MTERKKMPHPDFTNTHRRIGIVASLATFLCLVAYALALTLGLLSLESPQSPIRDPFFSIMEILIVTIAPLMVVAMAMVHAYASSEDKAYSLTALAFMIVLAGITSCVHFVILTVSRHPTAAAVPPIAFSFTWPSVAYALDILAWDVFFGLSMVFAALVFKGDRLATWLRITMLASGLLSIAGLIGVPLGDMQIRMFGVVGYVGVSLAVFPLLAMVFRDTHPGITG